MNLEFLHREYMLFLLAPTGVWLFFLLKSRQKFKQPLASLPSSPMVKLYSKTRWILRVLFVFNILGLLFLILASTRPIFSKSWTEKKSEGIDIVIVFDVSESMDATDFTPNRLRAAKNLVKDFIRKRTQDRIGLVAFGGESITRSVLTADKDFLMDQVEKMQTRELKQGTAIGLGLVNGLSRLKHSKAKTKMVLLLTDGDSNVGAVNPVTAAELARQNQIKIYTIGIGKENRVLVPLYAYDTIGKKQHVIAQVPSYLNPELLQKLSLMTGGKSYMARDAGMLNRILDEIDHLEKSKVLMRPKVERQEKFYYFLLFAILFLIPTHLILETRYRWKNPNYAAKV